MAVSTGSSGATADARASSPTLRSHLRPEQRSAALAAKLRSLVAGSWGDGQRESGSFPEGATLRDGSRAWVLLDGDPERRLGAVLAWGHHHAVDELHVMVDDPDAASVLARRASAFRSPPTVWRVDDRDLVPARPAPPPELAVPPPTAELYAAMLADAGLEVVVEAGEVRGEVLGLEVAHVVADEGGASRLEAGVGRFDREAFAMLHGALGDAESIAHVADVVRLQRRPDVDPHPLNRLVPERWLRAMVVAEPRVAGAVDLHPVEPAVARPNLTVRVPASAIGTGADGSALIVTCSTGVDLDLVPAAGDDRLLHAPDTRLVLVLPERDVLPITQAIAARLRDAAEIVALDDDWRRGFSEC